MFPGCVERISERLADLEEFVVYLFINFLLILFSKTMEIMKV